MSCFLDRVGGFFSLDVLSRNRLILSSSNSSWIISHRELIMLRRRSTFWCCLPRRKWLRYFLKKFSVCVCACDYHSLTHSLSTCLSVCVSCVSADACNMYVCQSAEKAAAGESCCEQVFLCLSICVCSSDASVSLSLSVCLSVCVSVSVTVYVSARPFL